MKRITLTNGTTITAHSVLRTGDVYEVSTEKQEGLDRVELQIPIYAVLYIENLSTL